MNALSDTSLANKCSMVNNHVATKKPKKNKKHNKSLDMNSDINEAELKSFERTSVEVSEQNINDSDFRENVKKLSSKKKYIKSLNLIELNSINDAEIKPLETICKEVNGQNIIDSYSRKNVKRKRKSEINCLVDISLSDNCSIDYENVPTKKTKKEKTHDRSLNSKELNTNHDTEIQTFERMHEEVNDSFQIIRSELNVSSNISLKHKYNMDKNNAVTKKSKKEKKHNKSLNSTELDSNHDKEIQILEKSYDEINDQNINDSDYRENVNQRIKSKLNTSTDIFLENKCMNTDNVATKNPNKKKKQNRNLNSIENNLYHDTEIQIFERPYEEVDDSHDSKNVNQRMRSELNASSNISLKNKCSMDKNNAVTKKSKKEKKLNKSLNLLELNTSIDTYFKTHEKNNEPNIDGSDHKENNIIQKKMLEVNALADMGNDCTNDSENIPTKKHKKKKNHNKSINIIEINTINDADCQAYEKNNEFKIKTLADISLKNDCNNDSENIATKNHKKKKNHNKSLNSKDINTNHDTEIKTFERTCKEVSEPNMNDSNTKELSFASLEMSYSLVDENIATKKHKKKKNHNKSINMIELNTINDADCQTYKKNNELKIKTFADISLKNDCNNDSENIATKNHKKKKNHNKSLNSRDINTNHDTEIKTFERTCKEVSEPNMNDSNTKESSFASLEMSYSLVDENIATKKKKKKKNHNKNLNPIELNTDNDVVCQTYEKNNEQKINDLPTKKDKKKKNHGKSLNSTEVDTNHGKEIQMLEKTYEAVNDSDYRENVNQTIKSKLNTSTDILLENQCSIDIDSVATKKPNKEQKHNTSLSSIEFNTNNDTYFRTYEKNNELNINCFNSKENIIQKRMPEMNTLVNISLRNDCNNDTENILTKNHSKNLSINTNHDTEFKTFGRTCKEVSEQSMNDSDTKELSSASLEINYGLDSENIATKESIKIKKLNILKTVISDCTDENKMLSQPNLTFPMISKNQCELKTLLNSMDNYNFEESSTIDKTNLNLKCFNLIRYLTSKDPSLKNHPNFKQINEYLSKKINLIINTKCKVGASDILLLKTVGNIILKKIVEKVNSAQDIKDLVIELPAECKENKIHFMETTLSRLPNKLKMDIIKEHNPLIKLRVFNKDEDKMIREYWSKFQKEYNISNILPFLSNGLEMALSPKERLQFIRYISAGLPNRLLYSVFNRFNILFNEYQDKTSFSEEEDQLIIKVDKCDAIRNKFSVLSLILNRTRLQLYRRIEVLRNQHIECKKVIWDDQKRQELFTNILLETNTEDWKHLKSLTITKDIWIKISKNLGEDFTYKKVRYQWNYLYTMLFCEKPILIPTFNLTVLELLKETNAKHWSDVDWIEITNKLYPGANSKVICSFFHSWIDKKVPSKIKENIRDTLNYLECHEVVKIKRRIYKYGEREFPRLTVIHFDLLVNNQ